MIFTSLQTMEYQKKDIQILQYLRYERIINKGKLEIEPRMLPIEFPLFIVPRTSI